ncbi:MAG: hypothetical protein LBP43_01145 [Treponema sp.]|jgi:hypothetical protein|nr:hypothetical protein [Treponema sp.]
MIQFYFLSIFFNAITGYILITDGDRDEESLGSGIRFSIRDKTLHLVLGILAAITGLLKLLSSIQGDVPVLGDIIPAIIGFVVGFILVFEYYRDHSSLDNEKYEKIEMILIKNKKFIGFVALISAGIHFLFPQVLLL